MSGISSARSRARAVPSPARGFTLIELIITIAIAAILMALAIPSFSDFSRSQTLSSHVAALHQDVTLARSEAVKRQQNVLVDAIGGDWTSGWTVYADANANSKLDTGEDVLHQQQALAGGYTMAGDNGKGGPKSSIAFNGRGALIGGGEADIVVCAKGYNKTKDDGYARHMRVASNGRAETGKGRGAGPTCGG